MEVTPKTMLTSVKVLRGVPLDISQTDTLTFGSVSNQISFFTSKAKETFTELTPIGLTNTIRLPKGADYFYDCNYIMFQNANFGNKWFYAFIKSIEYVGIERCNIVFELDDIQTWFFDWTVKPSYILREHSSTDNVGDNLVNESIDFGTYRNETAKRSTKFNQYNIVVAKTKTDETTIPTGLFQNMFQGLIYKVYDCTDEGANLIHKLLDDLTTQNKIDSVVSIFMAPKIMFGGNDPSNLGDDTIEKQQSTIGSYTPRNKKLLTYPYNYLQVYSSEGLSAIYKYEFFSSDECVFRFKGAVSCNSEIVITPRAYQNQLTNYEESLTVSGFPQCSWAIDSFKAYLAQNATKDTLGILGTATLGVGASALTGNVAGVVGGVLGSATQINNIVLASQKPPMIRGTQAVDTLVACRDKAIFYVNKHISEEYAKIVDEYFDMYGYATNRVKVPNIYSRPSWNYVQTNGAKIIGSIPFESVKRIKSYFDRGITFWHGDYVGDYTRNNRP